MINLLGIVWKRPFRLDVTDALKPGENKLEIKSNQFVGQQAHW